MAAKEPIKIALLGDDILHLEKLIHLTHDKNQRLNNHHFFIKTKPDIEHIIWSKGEFEQYNLKSVDLHSLHNYQGIIVTGQTLLPKNLIHEFDLHKKTHSIFGYHAQEQYIPIQYISSDHDLIQKIKTLVI